jgi:dUTP pyrophosphatase
MCCIDNNLVVKWKKLHKDAVIPQYQTTGSAGFDFHAVIENDLFYIPAKSQAIVDTGLSVAIPEGYEMQIRPRSGLSFKYSITVTNSPGTIDSDYRGPIKVILYNLGESPFIIKNGDRIAQGVLSFVPKFIFKEVEELDDTERGQGGFGSTGPK